MKEPSFTPEQTEKLLAIAGQKLGIDPQTLRETYQKEGLKGLSAALSPEAQAVIGDQQKTAALLQDPAIQRLLIQLLG